MTNSKHVVNIRGKDYLTVAGRVALAHETGRLLGVTMSSSDEFDAGGDYISVRAKVRILNESQMPLVEKLIAAAGREDKFNILANTINQLLVNEYEGIAKSPKEGSDAWMRLPANAPERSNPTEVCATSALGRALGAAGFGDTESFASADEITVATNRQASYSGTAPSGGSFASKASASKPPSDKQKKYLQTLVRQKLNITDNSEFSSLVNDKFNKGLDELSALDVSNWIDELAKAEEVPF